MMLRINYVRNRETNRHEFSHPKLSARRAKLFGSNLPESKAARKKDNIKEGREEADDRLDEGHLSLAC